MGQSLIKKSLVMLTLAQPGISTVVINELKFNKMGTLSSEISSSFIRYPGLPMIRCLAACKQLNCILAASGITDDHKQDCRLLPASPEIGGSTIPTDSFSGSLSLYKRKHQDSLPILQEPFGLFVHSPEEAGWGLKFDFCRGYGLSIFTPSNSQEMQALRNEYGNFWIGMNDRDIEGQYKTGEGAIIPKTHDLWCSDQPNNDHGNQDCVAVDIGNCYNDRECAFGYQAFCYIGK